MDKLRAHIEQVVTLTDEQFETVQTYFSLKRVKKRQFLIHEDDEVRQEYLVLKGIFKVYYIDKDGKEHIVQFAKENWWMTDFIAYFQQTPATMYVECMQEGEVLCLTLEGREALATKFHAMEHFFRVKLSNGYVALQKRIALLLSSSPQERYEEFSKMYPDLLQRIPKKFIAEYLGVSRETLSRLYSENNSEGVN